MTYEELTGHHRFNCEHAGYPSFLNHVKEENQELSLNVANQFNLMDLNVPIMDTRVYATTAWHRVIHKEIDPRQLRPYLGWRPTRIIKETLLRTTQVAKTIF